MSGTGGVVGFSSAIAVRLSSHTVTRSHGHKGRARSQSQAGPYVGQGHTSGTSPTYGADSDVQEADVLGIALDEGAPRLHVLAHQHREQVVGLRRVVQGDLAEHAVVDVH